MTSDTNQQRNRAKPGSSQPQGWDGPGWWDETKPASQPTASVRAAVGQPLRKTASRQPLADDWLDGTGANGSGSADKPGLLAARKAKSRGRSRARTTSPISLRFAIGFTLGLVGALFLVSAAVFGLSAAYDGKIMPGVHAGTVDLSGLTRDEAISKLDSAYAYLGQGKVTVNTPGGTGTITYQEAGRGPDSAAMADAALALGHSDNPLSSVAMTIRTMAGGSSVPVIVKLSPLELETRLHEMTAASMETPTDAKVIVDGSDYKVQSGVPGRGIDETAIANQMIDELANVNAPADLPIGGKFVTIPPNVSDEQAQAAIDSAAKVAVPLTLTNDTKTWTVTAAAVKKWIIFGVRTDGTYGPVVDPVQVKAYVTTLAKSANVNPIEPKITYVSGQPTGVQGGQAGVMLNVDATAQAVEAYLDGLGSGATQPDTSVALITDVTQPTINVDSIKGFVIVGQVATTYFPGESNGYGVNINLPATLLNGQVIGPGQHFSFLKAVGPIDAAHGWKMGGVIKNGQSNHTGAIGGGICSASTTTFQAVAVAGLQIDERHAHFYWIDRYALDKRVGLDATVYSNGNTTWDFRFTNDTAYPIVIKSWTGGGSGTRTIHVQLWSLPSGRKTTFTGGTMTNIVKAIDPPPQYVPSLPNHAKSYRKEYPDNGFDTTVSRTVTDATGAIIHSDTWASHYAKVDGWLQIAGTKPPAKTPTPKPTAPPVITPTPAPSARRRVLRPLPVA
jgi:vancomycin resistance protein YoaR